MSWSTGPRGYASKNEAGGNRNTQQHAYPPASAGAFRSHGQQNYRGHGAGQRGFVNNQYATQNQQSYGRGAVRPSQHPSISSGIDRGGFGNNSNAANYNSRQPPNPVAFCKQENSASSMDWESDSKPDVSFNDGAGVRFQSGGIHIKTEPVDAKPIVKFRNFVPSASKQQSIYADLYKRSLDELLQIIDIELLACTPPASKAEVFNHNARRLEKLSENRLVIEAKVQPARDTTSKTTAFVLVNEHELLRVESEGVRKSLELVKSEAVDLLLQKCRVLAAASSGRSSSAAHNDADDDGVDNVDDRAGSPTSSRGSPDGRKRTKGPKLAFGDFISNDLDQAQEADENYKKLSNRERALMRCVVMSTPKLSSQADIQQFFNHLVQLNSINGINMAHTSRQVRGDGKGGNAGTFHVTQIALNGDVIAVSNKNMNLKNSVREARAMAVKFLEDNCNYIDQTEPRHNECYRLRYDDIRSGTWEQVLSQQEAAFQSKNACCFDKSNFGRKMLEKMGWKEGDKLGVSDVSQFDARDVALRSRMPGSSTLQRAALGSVEGKMEEQIAGLLGWFSGQQVRNEWKVLQLFGLESRWRKLVHSQSASYLLNTNSVAVSYEKEKLMTISHKRSIGEILSAARASGTGAIGNYRVVREAQIRSNDEELEW